MKKSVFKFLLIFLCYTAIAQDHIFIPDLSKVKDTTKWVIIDRDVSYDGTLNFKPKAGEEPVWLKHYSFGNGLIDVDIKGENLQGQSFVGIAFHVIDNKTYDAIYFRPFNFLNPTRNTHSVQYISHPGNTWQKLREQFPGKYENKILTPPDPDGWFHVSIEINHPKVSVYVNNEKTASLIVEQLSTQKKGSVGVWVGYMSGGQFKNLKITSK
jgi:hypothetical protein